MGAPEPKLSNRGTGAFAVVVPEEVAGRLDREEAKVKSDEKCKVEGVLGVFGVAATGRLDGPKEEADFCMMTCTHGAVAAPLTGYNREPQCPPVDVRPSFGPPTSPSLTH